MFQKFREMRIVLCFVVIVQGLSLTFATNDGSNKLTLVVQWKLMDFLFPSAAEKDQAIKNGTYVPTNCVPIDVAVDSQRRIFVTFPRLPGLPATVGVVCGPDNLIQPYPDWSWHINAGNNCNGLTSVYRVAIDECQRIWMLDAGSRNCPPSIVCFDLTTDQLVFRYHFPANQHNDLSQFNNIVLDCNDPPPNGKCSDVKAVISDCDGFGILVYDLKRNLSWRLQNELVYPNPWYGTHTIAGQSFDQMDGVFGLAISPRCSKTAQRYLYFQSWAGNTENTVPWDIVINSTLWLQNVNSVPRQFVAIGERKNQAIVQVLNQDGMLLYTDDASSLSCWDTNTPFTCENIRVLIQDDEKLQFVGGLKIVPCSDKSGKQELWMLSNRLQKIATGTLNGSETNFRIQKVRMDVLLDDIKCTGDRPSKSCEN